MSENAPVAVAAVHAATEADVQAAKQLAVGVLSRAVSDPAYNERLRLDPKTCIAEFAARMNSGELSDAELETVAGGDLWKPVEYALIATGIVLGVAGSLIEGASHVQG